MSVSGYKFDDYKVLFPVSITGAMLVSCSVPEPDTTRLMGDGTTGEVAWVSGTTYSKNARVYRATTHRVYRDSAGGGGTTAPEYDKTRWIDEGPTNRWAWADGKSTTRTTWATAGGPLVIKVAPGAVPAIAASGLVGVREMRVQVEAVSLGGLVHDEVYSLADARPGSPWWSWFFLKPTYGDRIYVQGLPLAADAQITVSFSGSGASVGVASLMFGPIMSLASAEYGVDATPRSYAYSYTDDWGNSIDKPGATVKDLRVTCVMPTEQANAFTRSIEQLMGRAAYHIPHPDPKYRWLQTSGVIKPGGIKADNPAYVRGSFDVEGRT